MPVRINEASVARLAACITRQADVEWARLVPDGGRLPWRPSRCETLTGMPRSPVLSRKVRSFLGKPRLARLCTIDSKGFPHVVPIYFMRQGDDIIFGTDRGEVKVRNALRNPKAAVVIGGDPDEDEEGYMIQGVMKVESDPKLAIARRLLLRYESEEQAGNQLSEWSEGDTVLLRLKPKRVIRVW